MMMAPKWPFVRQQFFYLTFSRTKKFFPLGMCWRYKWKHSRIELATIFSERMKKISPNLQMGFSLKTTFHDAPLCCSLILVMSTLWPSRFWTILWSKAASKMSRLVNEVTSFDFRSLLAPPRMMASIKLLEIKYCKLFWERGNSKLF